MSGSDQGPGKRRPGRRELSGLTVGVLSFVAGAAIAGAFGFGEAMIAAGLVGLFVVQVAIAVPGAVSFRAAIACALIATVGLLIAEVSVGDPVVSGLVMGLVSFLTSLSAAGGRRFGAAGLILGTAYFLPAVIGLVDGIGVGDVGLVGFSGLAGGLVILAGLWALKGIRGGQEPRETAAEDPAAEPAPSGLALMWRELTSRGPFARSGARRGILLGVAMGLYQANHDHNLFWVMLTMYIVLQPDLEGTMNKAIKRSSGAVVGAILVAGLSQFLPGSAMVAIGVAALLFGLTWYRINYSVYAACVTILAVAINGEPSGDFLPWAGLRVLDTVIGATIALVSAYVLFPVRSGSEAGDDRA